MTSFKMEQHNVINPERAEKQSEAYMVTSLKNWERYLQD